MESNHQNDTNATLVNATNFNDNNGTFTVTFVNSVFEKTCFYTITTIGFFGNLLVLFVFFKSTELRRKMSNMLIMNQSMIDMTASLFMFLSKMFDGMDYPWITEPGLKVTIFCKFWLSEYIPWASMVVSTFNLVALTLERYVALMHPLFYKRHIKRIHIWIVIILVWVLGFTEDAYLVATSEMKGRLCSLWTEWPSEEFSRAAGIINLFIIEYFIPLCMMIFCYTRIVIMIQKQTRSNLGSSRQEVQMNRSRIVVIRTLIFVALGFFLCWTWFAVYCMLFYAGVVDTFAGLTFQIGAFASVCNCCINPFIYSFIHTVFRNAMIEIFTNGRHGQSVSSSHSRRTMVSRTMSEPEEPPVRTIAGTTTGTTFKEDWLNKLSNNFIAEDFSNKQVVLLHYKKQGQERQFK